MLICGRKIVNNDMFFGVTNIRTNVQNNYSELKQFLHEMMPKKTYMSQDIYYIIENGERKLCTVSTYIKYFLRIVDIENKQCHRCYNLKIPVEFFQIA